MAADASCSRRSLSNPHKVTPVHVLGQVPATGVAIWEGVLQGCCVSGWLGLLSLCEMASPSSLNTSGFDGPPLQEESLRILDIC